MSMQLQLRKRLSLIDCQLFRLPWPSLSLLAVRWGRERAEETVGRPDSIAASSLTRLARRGAIRTAAGCSKQLSSLSTQRQVASGTATGQRDAPHVAHSFRRASRRRATAARSESRSVSAAALTRRLPLTIGRTFGSPHRALKI
jgi:hypothetical protein